MKTKQLLSALLFTAAMLAFSPSHAAAATPTNGVISGYCFIDGNKNRRMDNGEQAAAGITVTLYKRNFVILKEEVATAVTDSKGQYAFSNLEQGSYVVKAGLAPAYRSTGFNPRWVFLWSQKMDKDVNFGLVRQVQHITIAGTVYLAPVQGGSVSPAEGAKITVSTDINGNGSIGMNERATATADSNGHYTVKAPVAAGMQSVVRFSLDGHAPLLKIILIGAARNISGFDGALVQMDDLSDNKNGTWRNQSGSVEITSSQISGGSVRSFNPATESDKFPGSFADSSGNMLVSGVFTAFDLQDANGNSLTATDPGNSARIRMRVPRDTWGSIVDTAPGTDRIDVPMFYFDEVTGQWVRGKTEQGEDLSGWIERDNGAIIAESELDAVRSGSFSGQIFATSNVTHFSYWNVDWPISSHACISGTLRDADGNPVAGATITVQGVTYTGGASPHITDENGKFCVDVMRSEAPGEDVNQNGVTGETQKVLISGSSGGKLYNFGEYVIPVQSGTCPANCLAVDLTATSDKEVQVSLCSLSGTAFIEGQPKEGISVYAFDDSIDPSTWDDVCGLACTFVAITDGAGAFSITSPVALRLSLSGYYIEQTEDPAGTFFYTTTKAFTECPTSAVSLNLDFMFCLVSLPAITYAGGIISLDPGNLPLTALMITGGTGLKWIVAATDTDAGFTASSITYGTVPAGATQSFPLQNAAPLALTTGDMILAVPLGGYVPYNGRQCYSNSVYTVQ